VKSSVPEEAVESGFLSFTIGFFLLLVLVIIVPSLIEPIGFTGATQILFVTLILFGASYLGSKMMQKIVARLSLSASSVLGERTLYIAQSLRRRKSKFIPLLIILTISLATTTMMLMESSSFETTIQNEIRYAIGADLRIECGEPKPLDFGEELKANATILNVTPVIDTYSSIGEQKIVLLGVNALEYLEIAHFSPTSFVDEEPEAILTRLRDIHNGIVISDKYASSLNKTTGDDVYSIFASGETNVYRRLQIVGRMRSAPGFGFASSDDSAYETVGGQLGYQVLHDGFALVNNYYLMSEANRHNASLFLASAEIDSSFSEFCDTLEASYHVNVISPHDTLEVSSYLDISQFLSGIQGITVISAILCAAMAIASTGLFFGTAILERKPEYAIFRALGATRRQVASMVLGEFAGLVVSVIAVSVVLGLLFGHSMSVLVFSIAPFDLVLPEILSLPILITVVILLIEWATMLVACLYPAQVAGSTKMVEELRNL
ncbi:MAG: ABC transporter permease, partial [Candidatus Thorarchaeota archaeon]